MTRRTIRRIKLLSGVSAATWTRIYRSMYPYWFPTGVLWVTFIAWDLDVWITDFAYEHAVAGFLVTFALFAGPMFAAEVQVRRELLKGYCTTRPLNIEFKSALSSFAYVDEQTGIVLARCDQLPSTGEGLIELKDFARREFDDTTVEIPVSLPNYRWTIVSPSFDWQRVSRPLYYDYLAVDSEPSAVETLQKMEPINTGK